MIAPVGAPVAIPTPVVCGRCGRLVDGPFYVELSTAGPPAVLCGACAYNELNDTICDGCGAEICRGESVWCGGCVSEDEGE